MWVVHNFNKTLKRWVIHNLLKTITFEVNNNPHSIFTQKKKTKQNNYNDNKNRCRPHGSLFKLSQA